jgi:signal transduction histidine kinase/CheY-like chemotaxis protein
VPVGDSPPPCAACERAHLRGEPTWASDSPRGVVFASPLLLGTRSYGALGFVFEPGRELRQLELVLLDDFGRQIALALDRARLYELAEQARERAEAASRAKDEFLAMLGHELRNPLSPMMTSMELMRLRAGDVAIKEREVIERQLLHMTRLVDDLLDVSRITRGTLSLSRQEVDLSTVVARAIEMASPMLEERAHRLTTAVPGGVAVFVDPDRIAQAVANLLTNAAKYTPNGGWVQVSVESVADRVRISVRDDGQGIDPSLMPHIFDLFVQDRQAIDRAGGGLGLGLAIVRKLVELHGGSVSAHSAGLGRGSTFTIELPLPCDATDIELLGPVSMVEPPRATASLRVLVVDDNPDAADMLAALLCARGHDARAVYDGPEALTVIEHFVPDLALLDIGLPVMDGFELAQHLRSRLACSTPVLVAVTGYGAPADVARSKAAGFDEHFVKPLQMDRLNGLLERIKSGEA